jgi:hypothetical protein
MSAATKDVRERLARLRQRLREAEEAMLAERRKEQELDRAYTQASKVRAEALPPGFHEERGLR